MKMHGYDVNPNVCGWLRDFLTDRQQRIMINNCKSNRLYCISGVSQGSILEPILFLIHINYLPDCIQHFEIFLYADDAIIFKRLNCRLNYVLLQRDLIRLYCKLV